MKNLLFYILLVLSITIASCVSQQETTQEDIQVQKFIRGESDTQRPIDPSTHSIRSNDPYDIRYYTTLQSNTSSGPMDAMKVMGQMRQYSYLDAETNWKPVHEIAIKTIGEIKVNQEDRASKLTNIEMISFFMLDKYFSRVSLNEEKAAAINYYLETLVQEGSRAELYLVTSNINRISTRLTPDKLKTYKDYYSSVIKGLLSDQATREPLKSWALAAREQLQ